MNETFNISIDILDDGCADEFDVVILGVEFDCPICHKNNEIISYRRHHDRYYWQRLDSNGHLKAESRINCRFCHAKFKTLESNIKAKTLIERIK